MNRRHLIVAVVSIALANINPSPLHGQSDPGPRPGPAAAGSFYPSLGPKEQVFFNQAQLRFQEVDSVSGGIAGETGSGLGPTFNGNSCARGPPHPTIKCKRRPQCHAQPTIGGSSPGIASPQNPIQNPQVALATLDGATNTD